MAICDGNSLPVAVSVASASPAEVKLAPGTMAARIVPDLPRAMVFDRAYDSNSFRSFLVDCGVEPIIPARRTSKHATHQDGRKLRRYRHRWKVERLNAWLQNDRRLVTRYERKPENFLGFVQLSCVKIWLRKCF
jgi:transposase